MLILDTDILIDIERGLAPAVEWFKALREPIGIVGFTAMELIQDARNSREVTLARKLVEPLPIFWPTEADCNSALELFAKLHRSHGVGLLDSLIAATVLGLGAELGTQNVKHFIPVPGIRLRLVYTRQG